MYQDRIGALPSPARIISSRSHDKRHYLRIIVFTDQPQAPVAFLPLLVVQHRRQSLPEVEVSTWTVGLDIQAKHVTIRELERDEAVARPLHDLHSLQTSIAWALSWISRPRLEQEFVPVKLLSLLFRLIRVGPESEGAEHPFPERVHPFEVFSVLLIAIPLVK